MMNRKFVYRAPSKEPNVENIAPSDSDLKEVGPIIWTSDIYDMVVVSSFGGIVQKHSEQAQVVVHPLVIFLLTLPLLVVQISTLVFLNLDYDFTAPVKLVSDNTEKDKLLHVLKIMMVVIVQVTMFSRILGSLRVLVFLATPTTWMWVNRPRHSDMEIALMRVLYSETFVVPTALIACLAHIIVDYNICMDSVSIILAADSMKEAVYDSLAITFLAELGAQWWAVVSMICHMEADGSFRFKRSKQDMLDSAWDKGFFLSRRSIRGIQTVVTSIVMFFICARQAYIVGMAVDTNVLPVARDLCTWWRFNSGEGGYKISRPAWYLTERLFLTANPRRAIDWIADPDGEGKGFCDGSYHLLRWSDLIELPGKHPIRTTQLWCVAALVLLAQVYYHFNSQIRDLFSFPEKEPVPEEDNTEAPEAGVGHGENQSYQRLLSAEQQPMSNEQHRAELTDLKSDHRDLGHQVLSLKRQLEEERSSRKSLEQSLRELASKVQSLEQRPAETKKSGFFK